MNASVLHLAALAAMVFIALLFLRAAVHKAQDYGRFLGFLADYRLVPEPLLGAVGRGLIGLELTVVALLLWPPVAIYGAIGACVLLGLYALAMAINLLRGRTLIECGCGGTGQPLSWLLVARNSALMALCVLAMRVPMQFTGAMDLLFALGAGLLAFGFYVIAELVNRNHATIKQRLS